MLALLGFVGLAVSSFVMLGSEQADDDDSHGPQGGDDQTGLTQIGPDLFQMLSDTDGDAGAGGVLVDSESFAKVADFASVSEAGNAMGVVPAVDLPDIDQATDQNAGATTVDPAPVATNNGLLDDMATTWTDDPTDTGSTLPVEEAPDVSTAAMIRRFGTFADDDLSGGITADEVFGGAGDDRMTGNMGNDILHGDEGRDLLSGGAGSDVLNGGDGDDTLAGGWNDDSLTGGDGKDLMIGGAGDDVLDGRDTDGGFDYLNGGAGDDLLLAGKGDHLNGGSGADTFGLLADGSNIIDDFDAAADILEITYTGTPPALHTVTTADGLTLFADDAIVAHLSGVSELNADQVLLITA